jgi:secondary thiamine-phosphate synthase enzyme
MAPYKSHQSAKGVLSMDSYWNQQQITLKAKKRGFHLLDDELSPYFQEISPIKTGLIHLFLLHTSASLIINENACADVRVDLETHFNHMVPEEMTYYTHTHEGPDDMPAHIKSSLLGNQLILPISDGKLVLGTWQGIYLCEHRDNAGGRKLMMTIHGKHNASS